VRKQTTWSTSFFAIIFLFSSILISSNFLALTKTVQAATLLEGTLVDVARVYENNTSNLTNFAVKNETNFLFSNFNNSEVEVWLEAQQVTFGEFGANHENFVSPSFISTLPNGSIYVYDSLRRLKLFDEQFQFVDNFNLVQTTTTYLPLGRISSITTDLKNNLYVLDYDNNMVLKKQDNESELAMLLDATSLGFTLTEHSQLVVSPNGEYIFLKNVNNEQNLYYLKNLSALTQIDLQSYGIATVSEIAIDCANNLFVLEQNPTVSLLHKLSRNTYAYESYLFVQNNALNNLSNLKINVETGTMFAMNTQTNTLQTISSETNFTENILSFTHPIDYTLQAPLQTSVQIARIKTNQTHLLQTPYNITPLYTLDENDMVIVLSEEVVEDNDYAYVLYNTTPTLQNASGYILKQHLEFLPEDVPTLHTVRILNNNTSFYKYPTTLTTNGQPIIVNSANKNEVFVIQNTANNITDSNGISFYAVALPNSEVAYVRTMDVVSEQVTVIEPTLFTNAEITITDGSEFVTVYENPETLTTLPYTLQKEKRIYITAYNSEQTYTQITFLNNQQEEVIGYIQTKYIKVYGDYNNLLQAFLLTTVSFILIVILIAVKTHKKSEEE
jgi:hypothetical protein